MYGKGLALTLACTSPLFLQPAVHFARFLAAGFTPAMHFDQFLAGSRALRLIPCGRTHPRRALPGFSCRLPCTSPVSLQGRNFVQGKRGSARQKALRMPVSACISAVFLQLAVHFACFLARVRAVARIWGKCTASCGNKGEVHVSPAAACRPSRAFPQISASRRKVRTHFGSPARRGEPLPEAGREVACGLGHYRRRAVDEPLRAGGPPDRETCRPNAGRVS